VNFVNEVIVRMNAGCWERVKDEMTVGKLVRVKGHMQGVLRPGSSVPRAELLAERVAFG